MSKALKVLLRVLVVCAGIAAGLISGAWYLSTRIPNFHWTLLASPTTILILSERFPRELNIALYLCSGGVVVGVLLATLLKSLKATADPESSVYGSSKWAGATELNKMGLFGGKGVFLGRHTDGRYVRHDGPEHLAVIAPTRSGKGVSVIVPTLLTCPYSVVVLDIKEENWNLTAGRRAEFSENIYFNLAHPHSAHFNPMLEIRLGVNEVRDAQNIAAAIIEPERSGFTNHWIRTATSFFTAALLHILYTAPAEKKTLAGVSEFINRPGATQHDMLLEMINAKHRRNPDTGELETHPAVAFSAQEVLNKGLEELPSVISSTASFLGLFRDPLVQQNTADSHFKISDLVLHDRPRSLYLVFQPPDLARLKPFIRMMVSMICSRLTEDPAPVGGKPLTRQRVLLLLDEFPALGRLEFFESALGFIAGYGLRAMLIMQSINQLKNAYGERTSIFDNTHIRLFYTPNTLETADYISKSLGTETVRFVTKSESARKGLQASGSVNEAEHFGGRPLLYSREVMELSDSKGILFVGGQRPIQVDKIRYHAKPDLGVFQKLLKGAPTKRDAINHVKPVTPRTLEEHSGEPPPSETLAVVHAKPCTPHSPTYSLFGEVCVSEEVRNETEE